MLRQIALVAVAGVMLGSLNGCIGGGAAVALGTAASMVSIAKDVLDVDVSLHSLINAHRPEQPIPPAALVTHPEYVITTPPPAALTPAPLVEAPPYVRY